MLILFIVGLLVIFLLILFAAAAATAPTKSVPTRPRLERVSTRQRATTPQPAPSKSLPEFVSKPRIAQPRREVPENQTDLFAPIERVRVPPSPFSDEEIRSVFNVPSPFKGAMSINLDAHCKLTGETHRVCSCQGSQELRSRYDSD